MIKTDGNDFGCDTQQIKMLKKKQLQVLTLDFTEDREITKENGMIDATPGSQETTSARIYCERISRNLTDTDVEEKVQKVIKIATTPRSQSKNNKCLKLKLRTSSPTRSWLLNKLRSKIDN
jgi:hypothetical protein